MEIYLNQLLTFEKKIPNSEHHFSQNKIKTIEASILGQARRLPSYEQECQYEVLIQTTNHRPLNHRVLWNFKNDVFKNSTLFAQAQNSLYNSHKIFVITEEIKTVIESYFQIPNFFTGTHVADKVPFFL